MYLVFEAGQGFLLVEKVLCILCAIDCCSVKCDVVFKLQTDIHKICITQNMQKRLFTQQQQKGQSSIEKYVVTHLSDNV